MNLQDPQHPSLGSFHWYPKILPVAIARLGTLIRSLNSLLRYGNADHRFKVFKRAHKTCGPIDNAYVPRSVANTVHLNLRCDGTAHGGCQAHCLIFWKEAWLKRPGEESEPHDITHNKTLRSAAPTSESLSTKEDLIRAAKKNIADGEVRYVCQATQLSEFTRPLKWWDARQYVEDYRSNNATLGQIFRTLSYTAYYFGTFANKPTLGRPARFLYDIFQAARGGVPFPRRKGTIRAGEPTPRDDLNLQPGELVRVKDYKDILSTVDETGANRGLMFDAEMVPLFAPVYLPRRISFALRKKT